MRLGLDHLAGLGHRHIPGQVSLVGFDDIAMAALPQIDLTTVGQDVHQTALAAVRLALGRLDAAASPIGDVLIPPYLVVRGTTGAPRTQSGRPG